jgi:hypothetical protein
VVLRGPLVVPAGPYGPAARIALQKVIPFPAGVKAYDESLSYAPSEGDRLCPICQESHLLRCHGFYVRWVILPGQAPFRIRVRRLLCPVVRRTVSLLPDFCLPKRQHGPEIVGLFLVGYLLNGLSLVMAMRRARPDAPLGHSLPQALLAAFGRRLPLIRTWLSGYHPRPPPLAGPASTRPRDLVHAVHWILEITDDAASSFRRMACLFHSDHGLGLL